MEYSGGANRQTPPVTSELAASRWSFLAKTFDPYHPCDIGFSVTNTDGITFWDTWQRLGLENVGYPISNRFIWQGFVTQAFQKTIFQWQPGRGVFLLNIFDELHKAGNDDALACSLGHP